MNYSYIEKAYKFLVANEKVLDEIGFFNETVDVSDLLEKNNYDFTFESGAGRICLITSADFVIKRDIRPHVMERFSSKKEYDNFLKLNPRFSHLFVSIEKLYFREQFFYIEEKIEPLFEKADEYPDWCFEDLENTSSMVDFLLEENLIDFDEAEFLIDNFVDIHSENCGWRKDTGEWICFDYSS